MVTIIRICGKQGREICTKGLSGKHECKLVAGHDEELCECRCKEMFHPISWYWPYE